MSWPTSGAPSGSGWPSPPIGGGGATDVGGYIMLPSPWGLNHNVTPAVANSTVAANNISAVIMQAPVAGALSKVGFLVVSCSANATVNVRIETVGADSNPTGTLVAAGANVNHNITTAMSNAWQEVTIGTPPTLTQGQLIAVVISNTVSAGAYVLGTVNSGITQVHFPFSSLFTASWARSVTPQICGVYIAGAWRNVPGIWPVKAIAATSYGSTSTPDERGMKITLPRAARAIGVWFQDIVANTSSAFNFKVYDSAGNTLVDKAWDADYRTSLNAHGRHVFLFDSSLSLIAGESYRVTRLPSTTNTVGFGYVDVNDASIMNALDLGANCISTSRTDAGAWTDTDTTRLLMGWVLDRIG